MYVFRSSDFFLEEADAWRDEAWEIIRSRSDVRFFLLTKRPQRVIKADWIFGPICGNKTRDRIREDTVLEDYPLYCPKCKQESLIEAENLHISVIKAPDAKTQSR